MARRTKGRRQGTLYATQSLPFATFLELKGMKRAEPCLRPLLNRSGRPTNRCEWWFEDPEGLADQLWEDYKEGEFFQYEHLRNGNLVELKNRRVG